MVFKLPIIFKRTRIWKQTVENTQHEVMAQYLLLLELQVALELVHSSGNRIAWVSQVRLQLVYRQPKCLHCKPCTT